MSLRRPRSAVEKSKQSQRMLKARMRVREGPGRRVNEIQQQLQSALRHGLAAENMLWSLRLTDWVIGLQATDIDGDGNIEIILGLRDGWIKVFTQFGLLKWERYLEQQYLSSLAVIPLHADTQEKYPRIIVGLRNGKIFAFDKNGRQFSNWVYEADRFVRQIAVSEHSPGYLVVGSEDRFVHVLDSATGILRWKFRTEGWIRSVFVKDIDGDGFDEILAGSGDKNLYIFNLQGDLLHTIATGYRVYFLWVGRIKENGPMSVFMSSNRKDLMAWHIERDAGGNWRHALAWLHASEDPARPFTNRIHTICIQDLDNDGEAEVLIGSEDGYLLILDGGGRLRWKLNLHSCVYRVHAMDVNYDGVAEIMIGTEDNRVCVLQFEPLTDLYDRIQTLVHDALHFFPFQKITENLAMRERTLLSEFITTSSPRPPRMEFEEAKRLMAEQQYEAALAILLRLSWQKAQYCWSQPWTGEGYLWGGYFTSLTGGSHDQLLVGTEKGYIYALDITQEQGTPTWSWSSSDQGYQRVRTICPGPMLPGNIPSIMAVLGDNRVVLLDHQGHLQQEQVLEKDQYWFAFFHQHADGTPDEIVLALEKPRIIFWDSALTTQTGQFEALQGSGSVYAYDLNGSGTTQIISGTLKNGVYSYTRSGEMLWHFPTQDRVETLYVADIDRDGYPEVIAGSEDRNVYVLDHEGHLKWRYRTLRGVMSIDVCDVKMEGDSADPQKRSLKILISSNDNYLYMLNGSGDLVWKYRCSNRARMIRARDANKDGLYEVAFSSENKLELLQILSIEEMGNLRRECWSKLTENYKDRNLLRKLTEHPDEYMRGGALAILAGLNEHNDEDFHYLQKALREESSLHIKFELVRAAAHLCQISENREKNRRRARQLLEGLYHSPEEEIRLEILRFLPFLDEGLFFEYLERSASYPDIWVRRAVVRRLDLLVEQHHERVFRLLLKTARDPEEWVRQESGRSLAHYFEAHLAQVVSDLSTLLNQDTDLDVYRQITYTLRQPDLKSIFQNLLRQLSEMSAENLTDILSEATRCISNLNRLGVFYGEEWLQTYEEFQQILSARTISALAGYQRITRSDILQDTPLARSALLIPVLDALEKVARVVATYERRQTVGERVSSLIEAQHILDEVRNNLQLSITLLSQPGRPQTGLLPEKRILALLIDQWSGVIRAELNRMRGTARLVLALANTTVPTNEEAVISLVIKNDGQCSADNVTIRLEENPSFTINGTDEQKLAEVSTKFPASVHFTLNLHDVSARLAFHVTYDDAEKRGKTLNFADEVSVQHHQRTYHFITNPYTTGTPIREKEMFYGRKDDLVFLRESLGSRATNRVVLLWGQRRMGKTSLIYRLAAELATLDYAPIFIDLQELALKENSAQLLEGFAWCIFNEILRYKQTRLAEPVAARFQTDPSSAFRDYLSSVRQWVPNHRLILLIDEFDGMNQYIKREGDDILYYLRSLMQHYPGLNFLLSGAPQMPYTEGYQSVLFNIAQARKLGKLKPEEARELLTEPVRQDLEYDPLALQQMLALTDGWPYFIHVLSEKLIEHCNTIQKAYVSVGEVNAALNLVLNEQSSSMRWIWQDLTSPTEKLVLSLLAQEKGDDGRVFTLNDLQRDFDEYGVQYVHKDVIEALRKLSRGDLIEEALDGVQYRMPVGLIKAWLRKDKPPERVIREENFLDEDLAS